jgi:hypothetical protein
MAYWLQLKGVFDAVNEVYPLIQVRSSLLYIDSANAKKMDKVSMNLSQLFEDVAIVKKAYLKEFSEPKEKIAIFPYCTVSGKRKVSLDPLSERAHKHVEALTNLSSMYKCVLLFIVQRNDVSQFCITKLDPTYKEACKKALDSGVIIKAISVRWDTQQCYYEKELEIVW